MSSGFFQLGILLHQLLQPEPRELYRNLGVFPISFSLVDSALAVFRMADFLSRTKALLAFGFLDDSFRHVEFLAARGEKLGDVVDGVVALAGVGRLGAFRALALPGRALVFVFVGVVRGRVVVAVAATLLTVGSRAIRARLRSCPSTDGAASLLVLRPDLRALPPESATARWLRASRCRSAAGRLRGSGSACPWRASCPRSTAGALPRCRPISSSVRECGNSPSSSPHRNTSGNSSPLAACSVMSVICARSS